MGCVQVHTAAISPEAYLFVMGLCNVFFVFFTMDGYKDLHTCLCLS